MLQSRLQYGVVLTPNLRLFAVGGVNEMCRATKTVEMLQFGGGSPEYQSVKQWLRVAPLLQPRHGHSVAYFEGRLIVAGGAPSVEAFRLPCKEFQHGQWTLIQPMKETVTVFSLLPCGSDLIGMGKSPCIYIALHPRKPHQVLSCMWARCDLGSIVINIDI